MMYQQTAESSSQTARLEDYLKAIRSRWPLVVAVTVLTALLAFFLAGSRAPSYKAEAAVVLGPSPVGSLNDVTMLAPSVENESDILRSQQVVEEAVLRVESVDDVAGVLQRTTVDYTNNSAVLTVSYTDDAPEKTMLMVNALVDEYVAQREGFATAFFERQTTAYANQLSQVAAEKLDIQTQFDTLSEQRKDAIASTVAGDNRTVLLTPIDAELEIVRAELADIRIQEREIVKGETEVRRRAEARDITARVLRYANPNPGQTGLSRNAITVVAAIFGFIFGVAAAFLADRLDTKARSGDKTSLALGAPIIGEIPNFGLAHRGGSASLAMLSGKNTSRMMRVREAIRRLRSSVFFLSSGEQNERASAVVISSAHPGEGKSTIAANLAIAMAQDGKRVALVSADLRRPTLETLFDIDSTQGLSSYLLGEIDEPVLVRSGIDELWVLPAGPTPANPGELLGSERFRELVVELRRESDFVIIDTPPILAAADTLNVSQSVDGVLIVVDSVATSTADLLQVRAELARSGVPLLGAVMNKQRIRRRILRKNHYDAYLSSGGE